METKRNHSIFLEINVAGVTRLLIIVTYNKFPSWSNWYSIYSISVYFAWILINPIGVDRININYTARESVMRE